MKDFVCILGEFYTNFHRLYFLVIWIWIKDLILQGRMLMWNFRFIFVQVVSSYELIYFLSNPRGKLALL